MATHRIPLFGFNTLPDTSGNIFFEPFPIKATNDRWDHGNFVFNDTSTEIAVFGTFNIPKNYTTTTAPRIVVVWTATPSTGTIVWDFNYRAVGGDNSESLDQAGTQEALSVSDSAPTAGFNRMEAYLTLTAANLVADDTVEFDLTRDGSNASDTLAVAGLLFNLLFEYVDA